MLLEHSHELESQEAPKVGSDFTALFDSIRSAGSAMVVLPYLVLVLCMEMELLHCVDNLRWNTILTHKLCLPHQRP